LWETIKGLEDDKKKLMRLFQVSKDKLRAELVEEREKFYAEGVGVIVDLDKKIITIL